MQVCVQVYVYGLELNEIGNMLGISVPGRGGPFSRGTELGPKKHMTTVGP